MPVMSWWENKDMDTSPEVLVNHIDQFGKGLSEWEVKFIASLIDSPPAAYSKKQIEIITRIYDEKC